MADAKGEPAKAAAGMADEFAEIRSRMVLLGDVMTAVANAETDSAEMRHMRRALA